MAICIEINVVIVISLNKHKIIFFVVGPGTDCLELKNIKP